VVTKRVCAPGAWTWALVLLAQAGVVRAQAELHVEVAVGACPDARQLRAALAPVLERDVTIVVEPTGAAARRARVIDRGERYAIEIDGAHREVEDPRRDCVERARVASVFIALNMQEPMQPAPVSTPATSDPPRTTDAPGTTSTPTTRERPAKPEQRDPDADEDADEAVDEADETAAEAAEEAAEAAREAAEAAREAAEASRPLPPEPPPGWGLWAFATGEHSSDAERTTFGAGAGVFYAFAPFRLELNAAALAPLPLALSPRDGIRGGVELMRIPFGVAASYRLRLRDVHVGPIAGLAFDLLHIEGSGVERPQTDVRLNLGALFGADLRLAVGSDVGLLVRLQMRFFPKSYRLVVDPTGRLGETPSVWLSGQLGVEWRL
jgi:hypothetical protein